MNKFFLRRNSGGSMPVLSSGKETSNKTVLIIHGFGSSKESFTALKLFDELPKIGVRAVAFDFPAHGENEASDIGPRLQDYIDSIKEIEYYVNFKNHDSEIYCFASSFGAYAALLHISSGKSLLKKAFLRCPAINMFDILRKNMSNIDADNLLEQGFFTANFTSRPVRVTLDFYGDLEKNNLFDVFNAYGVNIKIMHGTKDEIAPFEDALEFASKFNLDFTAVEGADHRFLLPENTRLIIDAAVHFFET